MMVLYGTIYGKSNINYHELLSFLKIINGNTALLQKYPKANIRSFR